MQLDAWFHKQFTDDAKALFNNETTIGVVYEAELEAEYAALVTAQGLFKVIIDELLVMRNQVTANYTIGELEHVDACEYARIMGQTEIANYLEKKLAELKK